MKVRVSIPGEYIVVEMANDQMELKSAFQQGVFHTYVRIYIGTETFLSKVYISIITDFTEL